MGESARAPWFDGSITSGSNPDQAALLSRMEREREGERERERERGKEREREG